MNRDSDWTAVQTVLFFRNQLTNVVSQKFIRKLQIMASAKAALKSPCVPLFQRGNFVRRTLTPLWKRGEGEIFGRNEAGIYGELLRQDSRTTCVVC